MRFNRINNSKCDGEDDEDDKEDDKNAKKTSTTTTTTKSSRRKKKLHRLLATSSSSEDELERKCGGATIQDTHEKRIPIDCDDSALEITPIISTIISNQKRYIDFIDDDIIGEVECRPYMYTVKFASDDAAIELSYRTGESRLLNRYIARHLLPHQIEGVKWLWGKYVSREGAILG